MRTITFYSYKGGVGRSLLVANTAKYLSTLGKSVFALDLDLEAPGLHYKFQLQNDSPISQGGRGVVDLLADFLKDGSLTDSLQDTIQDVAVPSDAGAIRIMRAGSAPQGEYWRRLSSIDWHDLFYGQDPVGIPFFLELKERIRADFSPDFLLIDARTGITEMGGVATTILPDAVVCLALCSVEHLDGLRAVMRGIQASLASRGQTGQVSIWPVISRLPFVRDPAYEDKQIAWVREYLNEPIGESHAQLKIDRVVVLHSEPMLESQEQLLVGGKNSPHDVPLLRDYLRLFSGLIPSEEIRPYVGRLIERATASLLDDPDLAQGELEALTAYCADEEAYRALLKLYRLRKAPLDKIVATAALMRQLGVPNSDPVLLDVVRMAFSEPRAADVQKKYAEFGEAVWRDGGMKDARIAMTLVTAYLPERKERAIGVLRDYVDRADPPNPLAVAKLVDLLRNGSSPALAADVVERFKAMASSAPEFQAAWVRLAIERRNPASARALFEDPFFRADAVQSEDPAAVIRLFKLAGRDEHESLLSEALEAAASSGHFGRIREVAELFLEEGRFDEVEVRLRNRGLPSHLIDDLTDSVQRRGRRSRIPF